MASYLSWGANAALFTLGCFLAADTGSAVVGSLLAAPPIEGEISEAPPPAVDRSWSQRQAIVTRNLFNSSTLAPPSTDAEPDEDLQPTKLQVRLLGTAAAGNPALARAAVEDKVNRKTLVVSVGDRILDKATVLRIERRRVILAENDARRELSLDDGQPRAPDRQAKRPGARSTRRSAAARRDSGARIRRLAEDRFAVPKSEVEETLRNPANLFSQARILPRYQDGDMVGMQVNAIKGGSLFEEIGLQDGDVITELNGISIDSPEQSAKLLREFSDAQEFRMVVERKDGSEDVLHFEPED
jgi:general secretion pathway protein C